jgi:hypothetical protein
MKSKRAANRSRRPREGFFFALARFTGLMLKVAGWLLLAIGVIGFIIMLVRIGPGLVGALQYPEQKMAGFIFILYLVNLLIFPVVGLVGAVMVGIGFVLGFIGTQPGVPTTIITTDQVSQPMEPPTQGAG